MLHYKIDYIDLAQSVPFSNKFQMDTGPPAACCHVTLKVGVLQLLIYKGKFVIKNSLYSTNLTWWPTKFLENFVTAIFSLKGSSLKGGLTVYSKSDFDVDLAQMAASVLLN